MFKATDPKKVMGTSFHGYIRTSYERLVSLFGEPNGIVDNNKTSTEWVLEDESGEVVAIYDYKQTNLHTRSNPSVEELRSQPLVEWHVGGYNKQSVQRLQELIINSL